MMRAALIGAATGGRSSAGPMALTASNPDRGALSKAAALLAFGGEVAVDKLPTAPSRLQPAPLVGRLGAAALAGRTLAKRRHSGVGEQLAAAAVAAATAAAVSAAAKTARGMAQRRGPAASTTAAIVEDLTSAGLALAACRA
jgi:hypothetical protein